MTPEGITAFFDEYIRRFMYNDISNATDKAGANFLVALGLSVYTEVMGGLVTGDMKILGKARANYKAFLHYIGSHYVQLDNKIDLYDRVRCGLAHEYFIKGPNVIAREIVDDKGSLDNMPGILLSPADNVLVINTDQGLVTLPKDTIAFGIRNYFRDFRQAVDKYHSELLVPGNAVLVNRFEKALMPRP